MEKNLLFYDLETSGLNMCFDQPLEFACIRTDWDLNELERVSFYIKLRDDVIPSPEAALVTGFNALTEPAGALTELEAARIIHELFNRPDTISIGYNSLNFDDEFLRFMFYRNLLAPYSHQFSNGCGRADLFPITVIYYLFHNDVMRWQADGADTSLKLANLGGLNGFFNGLQAHSALHDTMAALEMARRFKAKQPSTWEYLLGRFNKDTDREEIQKMRSEAATANKPVLAYAVDTRYGYAKNFIGMALDIGESRAYKNQTLWLRLDSENLQDTTTANLAETTMVIRKRLGDIPFILPLYPRYGTKIEPERAKLEQENLQWLLDNPRIYRQICDYHLDFRYPEAVNVDYEARLYIDGFISKTDEKWCRRFHEVTAGDKTAIIGQIQNPSLQQLGLRVLGRYYYDALTPGEQAFYDRHLAAVNALASEPLNDYKNRPRLTLSAVLSQIEALLQTAPDAAAVTVLNNLAQKLRLRAS